MNTINILLVEDDPLDVKNIESALQKIDVDFKLFKSNTGQEALQILRGGNLPEKVFILLDLGLPKMGGLEFLNTLRDDEQLKSKLVFVMTTSQSEEDKYKSYNLNVSGFFKKPTSRAEFAETISIIVDFYQLNEVDF